MRRALLLGMLAARVAAADEAPPVPHGVQLVRTDAAWRYQLVLAPQIGALAVSGLDVVAGRAQEPIAVLGDDQNAPAAWPYDVDKPLRATGELAPSAPVDQRIAALYAITTFPLTSAHHGLRVLE